MPTLIVWRINHLATKIWTLLGIVFLISTVVASPLQTRQASANGATRLVVNDEKIGPYLFRVAIRTFANRAIALRSQYPMLTLMVVYTVISLWIIAQPIVQ